MNINEKILQDLNKALLTKSLEVNSFIIDKHINDKNLCNTIVQNFNGESQLQPEVLSPTVLQPLEGGSHSGDNASIVSKQRSNRGAGQKKLKIQHGTKASTIQDVCKLEIQSLHPGHTDSIIMSLTTNSVESLQASVKNRIVLKSITKKKRKTFVFNDHMFIL